VYGDLGLIPITVENGAREPPDRNKPELLSHRPNKRCWTGRLQSFVEKTGGATQCHSGRGARASSYGSTCRLMTDPFRPDRGAGRHKNRASDASFRWAQDYERTAADSGIGMRIRKWNAGQRVHALAYRTRFGRPVLKGPELTQPVLFCVIPNRSQRLRGLIPRGNWS